jgi:cytochrome c-type biogenesis protein
MDKISVYMVFAEGLASFLSPCLLPLLPVYIGYLSGEATDGQYSKKKLIINSMFFSLGMSIVFILLGVTASSIGKFLNEYKFILMKIASVVIIIFGLFHMGILNLSFLYREKRFNYNFKKTNIINSILFGGVFAFGWSPCIGPILGSVLIIAGSTGSAAYGAYLLFIYSLGLSIPFIITAIVMDVLASKIKAVQKHSRAISIVSGVLLVIMGVALYNGWIFKLYSL